MDSGLLNSFLLSFSIIIFFVWYVCKTKQTKQIYDFIYTKIETYWLIDWLIDVTDM